MPPAATTQNTAKPASAWNRVKARPCAALRPAVLYSAGEWLVAILLSVNLAWTSLCLGGVRAETMVWSSALTFATAAIAMIRMIWSGSKSHWTAAWLVPFLLYAGASVLYITPVRWLGARELMLWIQAFLVFGIALENLQNKGPRRLVLGTVALLGAVALVLSAYQLNGHETWLMLGRVQAGQYVGRASGFLGNPNSLAAFYLLLIPPVLSLAWRRGANGVQRIACGYVALALMLGLVLTLSRGGVLAFTVALVCWPWFVGEWRFFRRALACAAVLAVAALAALAIWTTLPSARERAQKLVLDHGEKSRVILWQASLEITAGAPVLGTGAGSFNTVFEKHRPEGFLNNPQWTHNEFLNLLSDYGIAGFVLFFGAVCVIAWKSRRKRPRITNTPRTIPDGVLAETAFTRALGIGLLGFAFACMVDFHMHIPALAMIVAVCAAEIVKRREANTQPSQTAQGKNAPRDIPKKAAQIATARVFGQRVIGTAITLAVLALGGIVFVQTYRAEAARVSGREQIDALAGRDLKTASDRADRLQTLTRSAAFFDKAIRLDSDNAQAWSDRAYALALHARIEKQNAAQLGGEAETAARAALDRAPEVSEFWLRLGVALDLQARTNEAGDAFARALQLAPASPLAWYHQAYHLSLSPVKRSLALAAADMCLRLDPGHTDADSLRVKLQSNR
ncbi:O-antigen ligase [Ereboglobus sp. PH5-10]|uniref:O-antigen ligase family protein n=1 Tax=Ereboglobus sp. PH5-10 TaxID=2940629 RepID=UPI002406A1D0|nr:O-antigen ligase family protein [Ereboglobus sp. PH5-10]MDF9827584.1 O-antigen ligase [Ereboglobus sp. PH5-10]